VNADNVLAEQPKAHRRHLWAVADRVLGRFRRRRTGSSRVAVAQPLARLGDREPGRPADQGGRARVPGRASLAIGATWARSGLPPVCVGVGSRHPDSEALRADWVGVALRVVPSGSREPSWRVVKVELVADPQRGSGLDL